MVYRTLRSCRMTHEDGTRSPPMTGQPVTKATGDTSVLIWLLAQSIYPDNNKILFRVCFFSENTPLSVIGSKCLGKHSRLNSSRATLENKSIKNGKWGTMRNFHDICLRLSKCIVLRREHGRLTWGLELGLHVVHEQLVPGTSI